VKNYIKPVIIALAFLVLAIFILERACPRSDAKYQELKGEFKALEEKAEERKEQDKEIILAKNEEIEGLKNKNKIINKERLTLKKRDDDSQEKIYRLERDRELLTDKNSIIANLDQQVKELKLRFWNERADKDKADLLAKNWAEAYSKENKIRKMLEKQLADRDILLAICKEMNIEQEKQIKGLSFRLTFKNILYSGIAFGGGYLLGASK